MVRISVFYAASEGKKFDHDYFNTLGDFQKGMGQHGKELLGDVPNFTNIQPQIQISEIIG
jgi:hypothetical protein